MGRNSRAKSKTRGLPRSSSLLSGIEMYFSSSISPGNSSSLSPNSECQDLARLPVEIGFILAHAATAHEFERELQVRKADRHRATSEYLINVERAPPCQWNRAEHRPYCRHDDRPENVLGRPDRSPRARVKPGGALCRARNQGKSVPHPP